MWRSAGTRRRARWRSARFDPSFPNRMRGAAARRPFFLRTDVQEFRQSATHAGRERRSSVSLMRKTRLRKNARRQRRADRRRIVDRSLREKFGTMGASCLSSRRSRSIASWRKTRSSCAQQEQVSLWCKWQKKVRSKFPNATGSREYFPLGLTPTVSKYSPGQ